MDRILQFDRNYSGSVGIQRENPTNFSTCIFRLSSYLILLESCDMNGMLSNASIYFLRYNAF